VRSEDIVFKPPFFDQYLGLFQGIENLSVEQLVSELVSELAIENLNLAKALRKACSTLGQLELFWKGIP